MVRKGRRNHLLRSAQITARLRRGWLDLAVGIDPEVAASWSKGESDGVVEYLHGLGDRGVAVERYGPDQGLVLGDHP
jgi:hypothetical protein